MQMQKTKKRFLSNAILSLILLALMLPVVTVSVLAEDALSISADRTEVKAGEEVNVTVELTGNAIWAYQIELRANEMFIGDKTLIEDHDGSNSVTASFTLNAVAPGDGEIYAEAAYSDGETMIPLKEAVVKVSVAEAETEARQEPVKKPREGTGGQAAPKQVINGNVVPDLPEPEETEENTEQINEENEEANESRQTKGSGSKSDGRSGPESGDASQKQKSAGIWITIGILAALLLAGGCVFAVIQKKRKSNKS